MRAVIAEDSVLLRIGLVKVLEIAGFEVAAEVGDAESAAGRDRTAPARLAVLDVRMPPGFTDEGIRAALMIRRQFPRHGGPAAIAVRRGALCHRPAGHPTNGVGYLLKQRVADVDEFIDALRRVAAGGTALDPQVVSQLLRAPPQRPAPAAHPA